MTVMLYKHPGPVDLPQHGGCFETLVVMEGEVGARMAEGWHRTPAKALASHDAPEPVDAVIDLPPQSDDPQPKKRGRPRKDAI